MSEQVLREIHGKVSAIESKVDAINGSLLRTKQRFDKHEEESHTFRRQVSILWAAMNTLKWSVGTLIAAGGIGYLIRFVNGG